MSEKAYRIPSPITLTKVDTFFLSSFRIDFVREQVEIDVRQLDGLVPVGTLTRQFPLSALDANLAAIAGAPGTTFQEDLYIFLARTGVAPASGVLVSGVRMG